MVTVLFYKSDVRGADMKYKKVYAVMTKNPFIGSHLSREAYDTLKDAQAFCENGSDCPRKVSEYLYASSIITYSIHELVIRVPGKGRYT